MNTNSPGRFDWWHAAAGFAACVAIFSTLSKIGQELEHRLTTIEVKLIAVCDQVSQLRQDINRHDERDATQTKKSGTSL